MNTRKKTSLVLLVFIIGALVLGVGVNRLTTHIAVNEQKQYSHEKLELIEQLIRQSISAEEDITSNYDAKCKAEADTIAFLAQHSADFEYSDDYLAGLRSLLEADYLAVKDAAGKVVAEDGEIPDESSEPHTYTADIDASHKVELIQNTAVLQKALDENASLSAVLDDVHVGQDGFAFAVHKEKGTIIFHPDEALIGQSATEHGIDVSKLTDGADPDITIDGVRYFCSVKQIDKGLITTAVPYSEINANLTQTLVITLIIYVILAGIIILYCTFLRGEHEDNTERGYNAKLGRSVICIAVCGAIFAFAVTFYTQTLFTLSQQSITNNRRGTEMLKTLSRNSETLKEETHQYEEQYLNKAELASYIIEHTTDAAITREYMEELKNALQVDSVELFDKEGGIIASDSELWSYHISDDEEDQSYAFRSILDGSKRELVQDIMQDDTGNFRQYIACAVLDDNHKTVGMVEIGVTPDAIKEATLNTDLAAVLKGIQIGKGGFAFAVNVDDATFAYFPETALIGQSIFNFGMQEYMLKADYNDFITINGEKYYCASGEFAPYMTYIAVPYRAMNTTAFPVALISTAVMFIFMMILWGIYSFNGESVPAAENVSAPRTGEELIDVDMGEGRTAKARAVGFRWSHNGIDWDNMTAGHKTAYILNNVLTLLALFILIALIFADNIFAGDSLIHFILKGKWQRGINIFSVTYCILTVIAIIEITTLLRRFVMWLAHSMNAKGETICRMLDNFLRTFSGIVLIYFCLSTLGVDTATLLASAGILSLVIGLGAQSLVSDILAGLFIIFEGEFQVGDIVTIDGFSGTVAEIGVRTTKVKEGSGNVKIFSNSSVKNILNMTKDYSVVSIDMGIEYAEDLRYVERVLEEEFPTLKTELPAIVDGPFYRGVSELADSSVNIRIIAKCREEDRGQLDRDLRRRLKLIFDEHNINIPYPQLVINKPTQLTHDTTARQERQAESFVKQQTEEFKDTGIQEG